MTITPRLKTHYTSTFRKFGPNAQGVDWKNQEEADLRYQAMLNVISNHDLKNNIKVSVLDVGCGYGGQYLYAKNHGYNILYTGIDVVPEIIEYAKKQLTECRFLSVDIFKYSPKEKFDYIICNGILTQKLTATSAEMESFGHDLITKMFDLAKKGIVFNTMTTYVDFKKKGNYHVSPAKVLTEALKHTRYAKIDHAYPLYEYSVYMYKQAI
jgi:SAM-dependent methyltransferase